MTCTHSKSTSISSFGQVNYSQTYIQQNIKVQLPDMGVTKIKLQMLWIDGEEDLQLLTRKVQVVKGKEKKKKKKPTNH